MIVQGDCVALMAELAESSVDAIVTDPPYGLEFMGKEWDRLDAGLPQENVWKGRRGQGGSSVNDKPAAELFKAGVARVSYGAGKKQAFKRCVTCGKRAFSGSPCQCAEPEWVIEYPEGAPSSSIRMQRWHEAWAREALRILKPGGHLLAFGGTRTYHRLACAIEDAGFEIRDCLAWLYGSGFPKSLDVSKAIDKAAGARATIRPRFNTAGDVGEGNARNGYNDFTPHEAQTPEAEQWQGWGTALKPAHEPIVLARKPLAGTVAQNVLSTGCGALNIDGCRIEHANADDLATSQAKNPGRSDLVSSEVYGNGRPQQSVNDAGRWPANVLLDEQAAAMLDEQTGETVSRRSSGRNGSDEAAATFGLQRTEDLPRGHDDSGGASRFLYVAKASSAERNAGLDGFEAEFSPTMNNGIGGKEHDPETATRKRNVHPTVKPIELMRWLVRLVTPPGGTVLDPFTGSGTTGCAAALEGFDFIGMEREVEYVKIAEARIQWWSRHPDGLEIVKALEADRERRKIADSGQLGLLS